GFFQLHDLWITGCFKYGVIFDQSEVSSLTHSMIENDGTGVANSALVWLVSGSQHTALASELFTNVITVADCQLNGGTVGVVDDGGNTHTFRDNNFNGQSVAMKLCNTSSLIIMGNSFESVLLTGDANV